MMSHNEKLPDSWEVPQEFHRRLGRKAGRQRAMSTNQHLLLILHKPPESDETERHGRFFWRKPDGTWRSSDLGDGPSALDKHLKEFAAVAENLDEMEQCAVYAEEYFQLLRKTGPLHRTLRNMHQALQEARELLPEDRDIINFRDRANDLERTTELLYKDTQNGLDFAVARRAEEQAASNYHMALSAHRLNVLAAFFFPIMTLGTIFGMNLQNGLESWLAPGLFYIVVLGSLASGVFLRALITHKPAKPAGRNSDAP